MNKNSNEPSRKTVIEIIEAGAGYLENKGIENPRLICELLTGKLLNCKRLELPLKYDHVLSGKQIEAMRRGLKRTGSGEPVQYVTGSTEFMGHTFKTDRRALIPRPETEILVETVLKTDPLWASGKPAVIDIGTGSGCILISIAIARPEGLYIGCDISEEAVQLASENAKAAGVNEKTVFSSSDLSDLVEPESIDAVISNPPYIPTSVYEKLPANILNYEPREALDGGSDGLYVIEQIINDAAIVLKPRGFLFMEIGETQGQKATSILKENGFSDITVKQDLNKKDRIVTARN